MSVQEYALSSVLPIVGLMVPAPNVVLEDDFAGWAPSLCRLHVNRLFAASKRPDDMRQNLADLTASVPECARLLGMTGPQVIAFGCTSGSFYRGADWETETCATIRSETGVADVVLTARAAVQALHALGARRIAVASPYPPQVNDSMCSYLHAHGLEVTSLQVLDAWRGGGIPKLSAGQIEALVLSTAYPQADAVFVSCTNLRAAALVPRLEALTGRPVVTSNQATFWACMRAARVQHLPPGLGSLGRH
jgi:maleate cis-trans isomerase